MNCPSAGGDSKEAVENTAQLGSEESRQCTSIHAGKTHVCIFKKQKKKEADLEVGETVQQLR